jgi:hypothetical protein
MFHVIGINPEDESRFVIYTSRSQEDCEDVIQEEMAEESNEGWTYYIVVRVWNGL